MNKIEGHSHIGYIIKVTLEAPRTLSHPENLHNR